MTRLDILVIGCSIAGPTLATFLLLSPLPKTERPRIVILERSSILRSQGQNIDIRGAGVTIIRKLGLETIVRASTTGEAGVQWVDSKNCVVAQFAAASGRAPTSDIEILRGRLADICFRRSKSISEELQRAGGAGIEYIFDDYVEDLEHNGDKVNVRFAKSGEVQSFDIVVGADGLQSLTRRLVWGKEGERDRLVRLGMYAGFFSIPRTPTDSSWRRWYHAPGRRGIMLRPSDQSDRTTVFMSVINERDEKLIEVANGFQNVQAQKKLLQKYFADAGWESERVMKEMMKSNDFYYDIVGQVKVDKWSKGRVVLLGDAGYCASPISGMGTTLALNGAYVLAGALTRHSHDYAAAFADYEEKMRPLVNRAQKLAPGMPHLINPETTWGIWVLETLMSFLAWSRLALLAFRFFGPPADTVLVEEYGFEQPAELKG